MNCESTRHQLIDLAYSEGVETPELREHLATCEECTNFYTKLLQTRDMLGTLTLPDESDFRKIRATVVKAAAIAEKRKLIFDLVKFVGLILLVFGFYYEIYHWQGFTGLVYTYLGIYLVFPLVLFPLRRIKLLREGR